MGLGELSLQSREDAAMIRRGVGAGLRLIGERGVSTDLLNPPGADLPQKASGVPLTCPKDAYPQGTVTP